MTDIQLIALMAAQIYAQRHAAGTPAYDKSMAMWRATNEAKALLAIVSELQAEAHKK